jgi:hypothetical protein
MTDQELKDLVANLAVAQDRTDQQIAENQKLFKETDQRLKEVARQIGDLGNKFGSFTEGMAWPSMQKLLRQKFKMDTIGPRVIKRLNDRTMELDVLAYVNGETNAACVVEVKSHLRADGVKQMLQTMREFTHFFPEHRGKKVYGILAVVDAPENVKKQALDAGLYLARIHDENFTLDVPVDFRARDFGRMNGAAS